MLNKNSNIFVIPFFRYIGKNNDTSATGKFKSKGIGKVKAKQGVKGNIKGKIKKAQGKSR